jgi:monofunctional biosynthetic peptidoglycan transglycosylase
MLPGPRLAYNPYKSMSRVLKRSDMILGLLRKKGVLTEEEYRLALAELPNINGLQRKVDESIAKEVVQMPMTSASRTAPEATEPVKENELPAPQGAGEGQKPPDAGEPTGNVPAPASPGK